MLPYPFHFVDLFVGVPLENKLLKVTAISINDSNHESTDWRHIERFTKASNWQMGSGRTSCVLLMPETGRGVWGGGGGWGGGMAVSILNSLK